MVTSQSNSHKAVGLAKNLRSLRCCTSKLFVSSRSNKVIDNGDLPQPPFPHLLRSNTPPTEKEASLIREVIATAEVEESRLTERISNHSNHTRSESRLSLKDLKNKFDYTHQFIVEHMSILSTIRHVPPEILQIIFTHTLPPTPPSMHRVLYNSELPWALSQVCQLWRISMLSLSVMWRDFPVIDLSVDYTQKKTYLDFLNEMLKRSGNTPIRLIISGNDNFEQPSHPAIDLLVLHSDRWEKIRLYCLPAHLPSFQKIKGCLASLQSLRLVLFGGSTVTSYDLFQTAPQLRYIETATGFATFIFPTNPLLEYYHTSPSAHEIVRVILSSPTLRRLEFHGFHGFQGIDEIFPMTAVRLPKLTVLNAYLHPFTLFLHPFFNFITTPAIEELRVDSSAENAITPIRSMILRSGSPCLLKVLLLHVRFTPGELSSILSLTPLLTNLDITLPPTQDISALMFDGNAAPLVPLLDECVFLSWDEFDPPHSVETISALNLFASSRCDLPDIATSTETLLSGEFRPLKIFRILFNQPSNWYRENFQHFEGWDHTVIADELCRQRDRLVAILREFRVGWHDNFFKRRFNVKWTNEVIGLLNHLETLQDENAGDIYISGIYPIIHMISTQTDVESSFRLIAERILNKWEPILRRGMRNIRWLLNDLSLIYLSRTRSHALCSSPDAMQIFFDGISAHNLGML